MKYSEITLLGLDAEKIWIAAAGRICRGKAKVIKAGLWNCNFEQIVREQWISWYLGNPGKKRKLSRKRNMRNQRKKRGRVDKKGEILQRWLFLAQTEQFYKPWSRASDDKKTNFEGEEASSSGLGVTQEDAGADWVEQVFVKMMRMITITNIDIFMGPVGKCNICLPQ